MPRPKSKKNDKKTASQPDKSGKRTLPVPAPRPALPATLDPLKRYMDEVARYPLLTPEEEAAVARHYREHRDRESAQRLVLANLRLVVKIAMEYRSAFTNALDLIQEGNLGLLRAVDKYDVDKNVKFSSYAAWWVRAYVLKHIIDNFRLVKIGTTQAQKKLFFNLMREKEKMEQLGFSPTPKLLAEKLNVREDEVREMEVRMGSREAELDAPKPNYDGVRNVDFVSSGATDVEDKIEQGELKDILIKNLGEFTAGLKDKEKRIFTERLFAEVPKTLQEIADEYKITRERIRQIEERVVAKMRRFFADKGIEIGVNPRDN
jgi:RNA polymerase sigma-32 factor